MKIAAAPTRMVLLKTKRRAALAKRGHKLLKDKLDGLIGKFLEITKRTEEKLNELSRTVPEVFQLIVMAGSQMSPEEFEQAVSASEQRATIEIEKKNIMGVRIPVYKLKLEGSPISYSLAMTPAELDGALLNFNKILPELIYLAGNTKALELISQEITKVKRRVNALEYVLIPELSGAISFIKMKLAEMERSYLTSLMKIKDIVRAR
jgi:V/A-type H+-transporting ATPase subunit D